MPRVTTLTVTRDELIRAALRKLDVIGEGETPTTEDYTNCAFALNLMLKAWEQDGIYIWKIADISVPTVADNASYQIGETATGTGAVVTYRPIKIVEGCYIRDANGRDTPITPISRQEYNHLSDKTTAGIPNQIYYDAQLTNGVLYMYPRPEDATRTVHLVAQLPIYDFASGSETLDMAQEAYQAVVYGLADAVMDEYPLPSTPVVQRIMQKAEMFRQQLSDFSQEEASVFFQPAYFQR